MAGLVPAIHVLMSRRTWMPGTRPGVTISGTPDVGGEAAASRQDPHH